MKYTISNVTWYEDADGPYWSADLLKDGHIIGGIGSYYEMEGDREHSKRPDRAAQEEDVKRLLAEGLS